MANNQELRDEDFSQDVKDDQHMNGDEASTGEKSENGTDNGTENGNDLNDKLGENGQASGEAAGRDDDR